jgi:hypothetical protein
MVIVVNINPLFLHTEKRGCQVFKCFHMT